jgi:uncharacterized OsmC-like protein
LNADETIHHAIERTVKAVTLRPAVGQGTGVLKARLRPGLACDIEAGDWKLVCGMPDAFGGTNEGPTPGVFGRAALGACLAISYGMWAARLNVPLESVEVELQADYDSRGELAVSEDIRPGYLAMRYIVRIESQASEADVLRMIDSADHHSSYLDMFRHGVPVTRELQLSAPASAPAA